MNQGWLNRALAIADPFARRMFVAGIIQEGLRAEGVRPVVVGGMAVEWYTRGLYQSADIDLLCPTAPFEKVMTALGFTREGRHWFRADLNVAVEAPGVELESYRDRTATIEVEGVNVTLVSAEEAILDRLRAAVHWQSALDAEQALQMMVVHREALDWAYLERRAMRDEVQPKLAELRKRAADVP
jgi:hypothetical protein